jgi:hypothetical protein
MIGGWARRSWGWRLYLTLLRRRLHSTLRRRSLSGLLRRLLAPFGTLSDLILSRMPHNRYLPQIAFSGQCRRSDEG